MMPTINQSLEGNLDLSNFHPYERELPKAPVLNPTPSRNPFLRCPVPPLGAVSVDNLQQFNLNGLVPQYRVFR